MGISLTGYSMPIFWWGLLLILLFSVQLGLTPVSGRIAVLYYIEPVTGFLLIDTLLSGRRGRVPSRAVASDPADDRARHRAARRHRAHDALRHAGSARARTTSAPPRPRDCRRFRVIALHALRNALIPVVTVIGLQVGVLFTGAILTETIFSWPGVGKWLIEAIIRRDYPVLQGGTLLIGVVVMAVNLLVDLTYGLINPRIRHTR